jgi:hypothetical protein
MKKWITAERYQNNADARKATTIRSLFADIVPSIQTMRAAIPNVTPLEI